jgi:hypothetical protein
MDRFKNAIGFFTGSLLLTVASFLTALRLSLITGFPKGTDAYAHLTRIPWILTRFPQIHWNPSWDSGGYFWLWSYTPPGSILMALVVKLFGFSPEQALNYVSLASFLLFAFSLFWIMSSWSGPWLAIPIILVAVTTPALWSWWGHGGNYVRIWALGFYVLSIALFTNYLKNQNKKNYFFLALSLGFTLSTHMMFASLLLATLAGYILFAVAGWRNKIWFSLKTLGVALLLSAWWYLPMMASTRGGRFFELVSGGPATFEILQGIDPAHPFFTLPLSTTAMLILACALGFLGFFWKRKKIDLKIWGIIPAFLIATLIGVIYPFLGFLPGYAEKGHVAVMPPYAVWPLVIIFSCILLAGSLGVLWEKRKNSWLTIGFSLLASFLVSFLFIKTDFSSFKIYDMSQEETRQSLSMSAIKTLGHDPQFRLGTDSAFVADWFNYIYPNLPQTRDYFFQAIPYPTWQYFLEYTLWTQEDNLMETEWLLDWYGLRYITVGFASPRTKFDKFLKAKNLFQVEYEEEKGRFYVVKYLKPSPIITVSGASPVLVFGSLSDYEILVRNFAMAGWETDRAIPVYGGSRVAKTKLEELNNFPLVFLYRYRLTKENEISIIKKYVENGGRLLVEAYPGPEPQEWPIWFPVEESRLYEARDSWDFSQPTKGLNSFSEADFGFPFYKGHPWKIAAATPRDDSQIWLSTSEQPVVLQKEVGKGEIIWSGLNLPYHAEAFRNEFEIEVLSQLLKISSEPQPTNEVLVKKNEPHHRAWVVEEKIKGLVWRETWFPRWKISWIDSQGKKGRAVSYLAGPSLSYFLLPQEASYPLTIKADYQYQLSDNLGIGITVLTLLLLIIYLLEEKVFPPTITNLSKKFVKTIDSWWDIEE